MKLWECRYTLDCPLWTDEYIDYFYSTEPFTLEKMQKNWDKIHPGYYTVSKFNAVEVKSNLGPLGKMRLDIAAKIPSSAALTRCYKETIND